MLKRVVFGLKLVNPRLQCIHLRVQLPIGLPQLAHLLFLAPKVLLPTRQQLLLFLNVVQSGLDALPVQVESLDRLQLFDALSQILVVSQQPLNLVLQARVFTDLQMELVGELCDQQVLLADGAGQ